MADRRTSLDGTQPNRTSRNTQRSVSSAISARFDSQSSTGTAGLTNTRTRIVGQRTGFLADTIISAVQLGRLIGGFLRRIFMRVAAVVTPLGWTMLVLVPLSLLFGYLVGWIELIVVGFAGGALMIIAVIYLVGRNSIQIDLSIPHRRVVAGDDEDVAMKFGRDRAVGHGFLLVHLSAE